MVQQNEETKALTGASNGQNAEVRKISTRAVGRYPFCPTLIGMAHGMNFEHMPVAERMEHFTARAAGWRFQGIDVIVEQRRPVVLGGPITLGVGAALASVGNRQSPGRRRAARFVRGVERPGGAP